MKDFLVRNYNCYQYCTLVFAFVLDCCKIEELAFVDPISTTMDTDGHQNGRTLGSVRRLSQLYNDTTCHSEPCFD